MANNRANRGLTLILSTSVVLCGCTTTKAVEDADLFSAGNIGRYKREQAERERKAQELQHQATGARTRLDARLDEQRRLEAEEAALAAEFTQQSARVAALETELARLNSRKAIAAETYRAVIQRIAAIKASIARHRSVQSPTRAELQVAQQVAQRNGQVIKGLEDLRRSGYRDASARLKALD